MSWSRAVFPNFSPPLQPLLCFRYFPVSVDMNGSPSASHQGLHTSHPSICPSSIPAESYSGIPGGLSQLSLCERQGYTLDRVYPCPGWLIYAQSSIQAIKGPFIWIKYVGEKPTFRRIFWPLLFVELSHVNSSYEIILQQLHWVNLWTVD